MENGGIASARLHLRRATWRAGLIACALRGEPGERLQPRQRRRDVDPRAGRADQRARPATRRRSRSRRRATGTTRASATATRQGASASSASRRRCRCATASSARSSGRARTCDWIEACMARHAERMAAAGRAVLRRERPRDGPRRACRAVTVIEPAQRLAAGPTCASCGATATSLYFLAAATSPIRYKQTVIGVALGDPAAAARWPSSSRVFLGLLAKVAVGDGRALPGLRLLGHGRSGCSSPAALSRASDEHGRERDADLEGLLPAARHPARRACCRRSSTSPSAFVVAARRACWSTASCRRAADRCCVPLLVPRWLLAIALGIGLWLSALNVALPRRQHRRPVPHPGRPVRHADRLSVQPRPGRATSRSTRSTRWSAWSSCSAGCCFPDAAVPGGCCS